MHRLTDTAAKARQLFKQIRTAPPLLSGNSATPAKVLLGRMLFFDPRPSTSHAISCDSCHNIGLGGGDAEPTSIGHRWQFGGRNAPTVFNAVFNKARFWDGRAKDLERQAGGPIVNPVEMGGEGNIRLLLHATDPDYLEHRRGRPASKGCVRIPAAMNRFLDRHGVLDADYERAAGDALVVIDSSQPAGAISMSAAVPVPRGTREPAGEHACS